MKTFQDVVRQYDGMAERYDERYLTPSAFAEDRSVQRYLCARYPESFPKVLDLGCGTGLVLDLGITLPRNYTGVDPSRRMLNRLVEKHPDVARVYDMRAENLEIPVPKVDLVTATFGSPSYFQADFIRDVLPLLGRELFLMFYAEGYQPSYYGDEEIATKRAALDAAFELMERADHAANSRLGNFEMFTIETENLT